jgi:hypothetical protein
MTSEDLGGNLDAILEERTAGQKRFRKEYPDEAGEAMVIHPVL